MITFLPPLSLSPGALQVLPGGDELSAAAYTSCVRLIQHIGSQAQTFVSEHCGQDNSREVCVMQLA